VRLETKGYKINTVFFQYSCFLYLFIVDSWRQIADDIRIRVKHSNLQTKAETMKTEMPHKHIASNVYGFDLVCHLREIDTNHFGRYDYTDTTINGLNWRAEQQLVKDGFLDYADFSDAYFVLTEKAYDLLNDHGFKHGRSNYSRYRH